MKQIQNIIMLAVFLLASIPAMAGKRDAKATLIMRDGTKIENVDLQLPDKNMAKQIVIKEGNKGKKRKIASADIAKMMIWAPNFPNDVCELVYTKINFKPGVQAKDKQKPVWMMLVTKGPFASHWQSGWFEVRRKELILKMNNPNASYLWKNTDERPLLIVRQNKTYNKMLRTLKEYFADDPVLVAELDKDKGKEYKHELPRKGTFGSTVPYEWVNRLDYSKMVMEYCPRK